MEFRRFQQFIAVAEAGTISGAAARLYMSQSSLSASIAALERDLAVTLFRRGRHGVVLTPAGHALLEPARAAVRGVANAKIAAQTQQSAVPPLRIGTTFALPGLEADHAAAEIKARHPRMIVEVAHYGMMNISSFVADGELDIAITPVTRPLPENVDARGFTSTALAVICPIGHRLAGKAGIRPADLENETVITVAGHNPLDDVTDRLARRARSNRAPRMRAHTWLTALSLVRRGVGITLGPPFTGDFYPAGLAVGELEHPPSFESAILARSDARHDDAIAEFCTVLNGLKQSAAPAT